MSVTLHTTLGDLKLELKCGAREAPKASENFLALAASGYYNGTRFHRNIKGFIVQGGDPTGKGKGGESVWGGTFADEFTSTLRHDRPGVVSMANNGPNTNGSQFFLTYAKHAQLDNLYTIFGELIDGGETLDAMERAPIGKKHRPLTDIVIKKVTIHANPFANVDTT